MELTIETIAEKLNSLYEEVVNQPVIYWVQNLRHPDYKLTAAISVVVQRDTNNQYVASYDDVDIYGCGEDVNAAIEDMLLCLVDYYESLVGEPDENLGPLPLQHKNFLQTLISNATKV